MREKKGMLAEVLFRLTVVVVGMVCYSYASSKGVCLAMRGGGVVRWIVLSLANLLTGGLLGLWCYGTLTE